MQTSKRRWAFVWILVVVLCIVAAGVYYKMAEAARAYSYRPDETVKIIFDADIDTDIDDVGALAVLHTYIREGKAELLAAVGSCNSGYAAPCLDAINTWYGLPDVPVGIAPICPSSGESKYQKYIAENYTNDILRDENAKSAVSVYREALAKAKNKSVVIVVTGPLNNLCDLLRSDGDEYSRLGGVALVKKKVKLCVVMGGKFPESDPEGEYNIRLAPEAAAFVAQNCPAHIMWIGFEVGENVLTGNRTYEMDPQSPIRTAYALYSDDQPDFRRSSWDMIAVMYAVEGSGSYWYVNKGSILFTQDEQADQNPDAGAGYNRWQWDSKGKDAFLAAQKTSEEVAAYLDGKMVGITEIY